MIKQKPSEARWICCLHDPAILSAEDKDIEDYATERDLKKLGVDEETGVFKATGEMVSLFKILPLRSESFHLIDLGTPAYHQIFRTHVVAVKNVPGVKVETKENKSYIKDDSMENVDFETLSEVATVISNLGMGRDGEDRAFFSGDFLRHQRMRSRKLPANRARLDPAKITKKDSNLEDQNQGSNS